MNRFEFYDKLNTYKELQHSSPLKGMQKQNAKYYKREGKPGEYLYYYTKEQYENAQKEKEKNAQNIKSAMLMRDINKAAQKEADAKKTNSYASKNAAEAETKKREEYEFEKKRKAAENKIRANYWNNDPSAYQEYERKKAGTVKKGIATKEEEEQARRDWQNGYMSGNEYGRYDYKIEKGHGFVDPSEYSEETQKEFARIGVTKPYISPMNYSYQWTDNNYEGNHYWEAPRGNKEWTDLDYENVVYFNKPTIDHCLDFYKTYVIDKKKMTSYEAAEAINEYLHEIFDDSYDLKKRNIDIDKFRSAISSEIRKQIRHIKNLNEAEEKTKEQKRKEAEYNKNKDAAQNYEADRWKKK